MNYLPFVAAGWSYAKTTQNKLINRWVSYGLMSVLSGAAAVETGTIREYFTRATIPDFRMRGIITIYAKTMTSTARKELMTRFTATSISPRRYTEPPIFKRTIKKEFKVHNIITMYVKIINNATIKDLTSRVKKTLNKTFTFKG